MKKVKVLVVAIALFHVADVKAQSFGSFVNKAKDALGKGSGNGSSSGSSFSNSEAVSALKEALKIGTQNASGRVSAVNGYFGNALIKVVMPTEAKKVENTLRAIGMGAQVDKAILSMNRAAEDAATKAVPIFVDAITGMSIQDGITIVRGGQGAATNYLKSRTTQSLTATYRPIVEASLNKVNATKYWADIFTVYNKLPTTSNKVNTDLVAYVTDRALEGLFLTIAQEENKIRQDPAARVSDLLKKVFGGH